MQTVAASDRNVSIRFVCVFARLLCAILPVLQCAHTKPSPHLPHTQPGLPESECGMMSTLYTMAFAVAALASCGLWVWRRRLAYRVSWLCDGPTALPLIGNAHMLLSYRNDYATLLSMLCKRFRSPIRFWAGSELVLIVHDRDDIETVFKSNNCMRRLYNYDYIRDAISDKSDGLFTSHGNTWKTHRRFVGQAFGLHTIYSHLPIFGEHMMQLVQGLDAHVGGPPIDIRLWLNKSTLSMFLESMLGSDFTPEEKRNFSQYLTRGQQVLAKRLFMPWYQNEFIWSLTSFPKELKTYMVYSSMLVDRILACRMADTSSDLTFVDRLLHISEENPSFNLEDVKAEATTLLYGASDTTSLTIAFTILMLAMHPQCQERVYAELTAIMPDANTPLTSEHIERMEYTDRCIKETLRLYPPVPIVGRTVEHEMKLKDVTVHPGQGIILALGRLQRNPAYWGDRADEFDPDNFLPERVAKRDPFVYCPFAEGARICIAYKYAQVVTRAMLFHLFRHHRYSTELRLPDLKIEFNVNVRLLNNHMVSVHRRTESAGRA